MITPVIVAPVRVIRSQAPRQVESGRSFMRDREQCARMTGSEERRAMAEQPCVQVTSRPAARVAAVEGRGWIGMVLDNREHDR
jgi:hypothetical protein